MRNCENLLVNVMGSNKNKRSYRLPKSLKKSRLQQCAIRNNPSIKNKGPLLAKYANKYVKKNYDFGVIRRKSPKKKKHKKLSRDYKKKRKGYNETNYKLCTINNNRKNININTNSNTNNRNKSNINQHNIWTEKYFDVDSGKMINIRDIKMYKIPYLNRDNPCIQEGILSLANCRSDLRKSAKEGTLIIGVSANDHHQTKILFGAICDTFIQSLHYFEGTLNQLNAKSNKYRHRRDCKYMVPHGKLTKIKLWLGPATDIKEVIYWISRLSKKSSTRFGL